MLKDADEAQKSDRLFTLLQDLACTASLDRRLQTLNPAWERILGYSDDSLKGKTLTDYIHPDDFQATLSELNKLRIPEQSVSFENRFRCHDGTYKLLSWNTTLVAENGPLFLMARDITSANQAEQELRRRAVGLETVAKVSAATARILEVDPLLQTVAELTKESFNLYHAHVYLLNETGEQLVLAAGAGEPGRLMKARGHQIAFSNPRSLVARAARTRQGVVENDVTAAEDFLPNPMLPKTRSEMAVPMVVGETLIGVLDVQSDVINRFTPADVQIQTALSDQIAVAVQNASLYAKQVEVAEQFRTVDRLKSEFLANMSHELRTPLNSIIGFAEVLADGIDGDLPEEALEDVNAIHDSGQHLLSMINDILDLAKIEAGRMELDLVSVPLTSIADEVRRLTSVLFKEKPVDLTISIPDSLPALWADKVRLRQILNNLVSNASKFTHEGEVRIEARLLEHKDAVARQRDAQGDMVLISVQDTGEGIAKENLNLIFEQFRQADSSSTRKAGGTGMGLAITRHLVRLHGGEIWVESEPNKGSTFSFLIPVASSQ